jgi:hypothetical protein
VAWDHLAASRGTTRGSPVEALPPVDLPPSASGSGRRRWRSGRFQYSRFERSTAGLRGEGIRPVERLSGVNRKTVRRYVEAAVAHGLRSDGGEVQLTDEFSRSVVEAVRPHPGDGHGDAWRLLAGHHDRIKAWPDEGLTAVKVGEPSAREGVVAPERTLHRYALAERGHGRRPKITVRLADGEPGDELQVDFGRMGLVSDSGAGRNHVCHALIFTAC